MKTQGKSLSADSAAVAPFQERLQEIVEEEHLTCDQVFDCDEMGLNWSSLPKRTLVSERKTEAKGVKKVKDRVTLMACTNTTESITMPLTIMWAATPVDV